MGMLKPVRTAAGGVVLIAGACSCCQTQRDSGGVGPLLREDRQAGLQDGAAQSIFSPEPVEAQLWGRGLTGWGAGPRYGGLNPRAREYRRAIGAGVGDNAICERTGAPTSRHTEAAPAHS